MSDDRPPGARGPQDDAGTAVSPRSTVHPSTGPRSPMPSRPAVSSGTDAARWSARWSSEQTAAGNTTPSSNGARDTIDGHPRQEGRPGLGRQDQAARPERKQGSLLRELPVLLAVALILALLIKAFLVQAFYIPSGSMEDTLQVGDRVLVNKVVYHLRDIQRGDIVVFSGLDSWTPEVQVAEPTNPIGRALRGLASAFGVAPPGERDFIKRVIGVPGDVVSCRDTAVYVNDVGLDESSYLYAGNTGCGADDDFEVTVPEGRLWVMGDHRAASADSRAHLSDPYQGTVPADRVIGRAFVVVWPVSDWGTLSIPDTFEQPALRAAGAADAAVAAGVGLLPVLPLTLLALRRRRRRRV